MNQKIYQLARTKTQLVDVGNVQCNLASQTDSIPFVLRGVRRLDFRLAFG